MLLNRGRASVCNRRSSRLALLGLPCECQMLAERLRLSAAFSWGLPLQRPTTNDVDARHRNHKAQQSGWLSGDATAVERGKRPLLLCFGEEDAKVAAAAGEFRGRILACYSTEPAEERRRGGKVNKTPERKSKQRKQQCQLAARFDSHPGTVMYLKKIGKNSVTIFSLLYVTADLLCMHLIPPRCTKINIAASLIPHPCARLFPDPSMPVQYSAVEPAKVRAHCP